MDEEKELKMPKVRKTSAEEVLWKFWNHHLNEIVSAWINIHIFEGKEPNEVVGERTGPPIKEGQMGLRIQVKAKEALESERKKFDNQALVLVSIMKRLNDLKKLKSDDQIWRKK